MLGTCCSLANFKIAARVARTNGEHYGTMRRIRQLGDRRADFSNSANMRCDDMDRCIGQQSLELPPGDTKAEPHELALQNRACLDDALIERESHIIREFVAGLKNRSISCDGP